MVDCQHENLQWKISANNTPRYNHIFRCIRQGLGCFVSRDYHGGSMVFSGELLAHKCSKIRRSEAINFSLTKFKKLNSIHLRIDNMTALSYLLNTGGTLKKHLIEISKKIWRYFIEKKVHLTAEYIPNLNNQIADWASRNFQDSSKW